MLIVVYHEKVVMYSMLLSLQRLARLEYHYAVESTTGATMISVGQQHRRNVQRYPHASKSNKHGVHYLNRYQDNHHMPQASDQRQRQEDIGCHYSCCCCCCCSIAGGLPRLGRCSAAPLYTIAVSSLATPVRSNISRPAGPK